MNMKLRSPRNLVALAAALILVGGTASSASASVLDESSCGDLYQLQRTGNTVRIIALSSDVTRVWGKNRYGITKVWHSSNGSQGTYVSGYNTSSTGGANFTVTSSDKWWTLALVDDNGYEWCRGLYYK